MNNINVESLISIFKELDQGLKSVGLTRDIYICGGAAIMLFGKKDRTTMDIDVVDPFIGIDDNGIGEIASMVADKFGLSEFYINSQTTGLLRHFPENWKESSVLKYSGSSLRVFVVSRRELINSKFDAMLNRAGRDEDDLIWMRPTENELLESKKYVMGKNKNVPEAVIDDTINYLISRTSRGD